MIHRIWFWLPFALLAGNSLTLANAELHLVKLGDAPDLIEFHFEDKSTHLLLEAANGFVMKPNAIPESRSARLYGASSESSPRGTDLGKINLPGFGRHIMLVSRTDPSKPLIKTLPFDRSAHPPGGVRFLNLTSLKIRCSLDADTTEIAPGEDKLDKNIDPSRRIVNHRLQSWEKKGWKNENATTLILGANKRFIFVFSQAKPNGAILRTLITDFDPEGNLAPLTPSAVRAEPPLPDPPAK
jgi:hypothetical protein